MKVGDYTFTRDKHGTIIEDLRKNGTAVCVSNDVLVSGFVHSLIDEIIRLQGVIDEEHDAYREAAIEARASKAVIRLQRVELYEVKLRLAQADRKLASIKIDRASFRVLQARVENVTGKDIDPVSWLEEQLEGDSGC